MLAHGLDVHMGGSRIRHLWTRETKVKNVTHCSRSRAVGRQRCLRSARFAGNMVVTDTHLLQVGDRVERSLFIRDSPENVSTLLIVQQNMTLTRPCGIAFHRRLILYQRTRTQTKHRTSCITHECRH